MDENRFFAFITHGMTMQQRRNVMYWLGGSTARLRNMHELYNLALFRLAALQCVHIVDVTSPMLSCPHFDELLEMDGMTLSPTGQKLVNDELFKVQVHEAVA
jgi:hypothetical protein